MKKLTKSKAEVWDRLKNGIPSQSNEFEKIDLLISKQLAQQLADLIDEEIVKDMINLSK